MTFSQLRTLIAVADAGSLHAAADALFITPSAVSHALRLLEKELECTLLHRTSGGTVVTEAGACVVAHARAILERETELRMAARDGSGSRTQIRVGAVPSVNARVMPGVMAQLRRRTPDLDVVLLEGTDDEVGRWLAGGVIEVGFTGRLADGELDDDVVLEDRIFAVVPSVHLLAERREVSLRDIAAEPFIMSTGGCESMIRALAARDGVDLNVNHEVRDAATLVAMVGAGLGVTVMPELALPAVSPAVRSVALAPSATRAIVARRGDCDPDGGGADHLLREMRRWAADTA